jgi:hypothetical protein
MELLQMSIDKNRLDRMIDTMDNWLKQHEKDRLNGYDDDEDTNPQTIPRTSGAPTAHS